jgi:hypothetical protein
MTPGAPSSQAARNTSRVAVIAVLGILAAAVLANAGVTDNVQHAVTPLAGDAIRTLGGLVASAIKAVTP